MQDLGVIKSYDHSENNYMHIECRHKKGYHVKIGNDIVITHNDCSEISVSPNLEHVLRLTPGEKR